MAGETRVERVVEGSPSAPELGAIAGEAARAFDLKARATAGGGWVLSGGTLFTADPESGVLVVEVEPQEGGLRLSARTRAFPGAGAKARRILEARLTAVEDFFQARLRGRPAGEIVVAPLYRFGDPGLAGTVIALAWVGLSTAAALLLAYAASVGLGCVLMRRQLEEQAGRSRFIQMALNKDPLPRLEEINAAGSAEILGAAAVFAVPWAFLVGLMAAFSLAWSEMSARASEHVLWMVRDLLMSALLGWIALSLDARWWAGLAAMMLISADLAGAPGRKIAVGIRGLVAIGVAGLLAWQTVLRVKGEAAPLLDFVLLGLALYLGTFAGPAVGFYVQFFLVVAIGGLLLMAIGPLEAVAFGVTIPLSAFAGYLLLWGRRREKREDRDRQKREVDGRRAAAGLAVAAVMLAGLAWGAVPDPQDREEVPVGMARFRDRMMMTNPVGRWLAEFYYHHTLPAAGANQTAFDEKLGRLQTTVLMVASEGSVAGVLRRNGAYVTEAWDAVMDPADARRRFDHPYDLIVIPGIVRSRQKGEDRGEKMEVPHLQELRARGLWPRTLVLAPIRTHFPGANVLLDRLQNQIMPKVDPKFGRVHSLWKQVQASTGQEQVQLLSKLKAELDRTPWDVPEGFPADQVVRLPFEDEKSVMVQVAHVAGKSSPGKFLRDPVSMGWLAVFYLGGALAVGALVMPPALAAAVLYRRRGRRAALMFCAALCGGSVVGLIAWGAPGAPVRGAISELQGLGPDQAARAAALMEHPEADVRYEAVFWAERKLKATRQAEDQCLDDIDTLQRKPMTGDIKDNEKRQRAREEEMTRLWETLGLAQQAHEALSASLKEALVRRLEDADVRVRVWACGALGQGGIVDGPEGLDPLLKATRDPEFFVRYRAAEALSDVARYGGNAAGIRRATVSREAYDALLKAGKVVELMVEEDKVTARLRNPTQDFMLKGVFFPHVLVMIPGLDEAILKELTAADPPPKVRRPSQARVTAEVIPRLQQMVREDRWYVGNYALRALRRIKSDGGF